MYSPSNSFEKVALFRFIFSSFLTRSKACPRATRYCRARILSLWKFLDKVDIWNLNKKGSFGKVHQVEHILTKTDYAIKVISKIQVINLKMKEQLKNEIVIMQKVHHENIIRLVTYFEDEKCVYLVMELCGVKQLSNSSLICTPLWKRKEFLKKRELLR